MPGLFFMWRIIKSYLFYTWGGLHRYFGNQNNLVKEYRRAVDYFTRAYETNAEMQQALLARAVLLGRELAEPDAALADLETLLEWIRSLGGRTVATLPLLATVDQGPGTSPYAPVSRLFWNEIFLDVERLAGSLGVAGASATADAGGMAGGVAAPARGSEIEGLREAERVDYGRVARLKRRAPFSLRPCNNHRSETERCERSDRVLLECGAER